MEQKIIEGLYLGEYPVKGYLINSWKTLNRNNAYKIQLLEPQYFLGCDHTEVILFDEDLTLESNEHNSDD